MEIVQAGMDPMKIMQTDAPGPSKVERNITNVRFFGALHRYCPGMGDGAGLLLDWGHPRVVDGCHPPPS